MARQKVDAAAAGDWHKVVELAERTTGTSTTGGETHILRIIRLARDLMAKGGVRKAADTLAMIEGLGPIRPPDSVIDSLFPREPTQIPATPDTPLPSSSKSVSRTAVEAQLREARDHVSDAEADEAWTGFVWGHLRKVSRFSRAGPCGLSRDLLLSLASINGGAPIRGVFAEVVDRALAGRLRGSYLTDSALSFISKPAGGVRPIGIGGLVRRVAGRIAAASLAGLWRAELESKDQYGLSESGAARAAFRIGRHVDEGASVLRMDLRNAFNSIHRRTVVRVIPPDHAASALAWSLYGSESQGTTRDGPVPISRGVVQGCPLAPALFARAFQVARDEARLAVPEALREGVEEVVYADDVFLIGRNPDALKTVADAYTTACARHGLDTAPSKYKFLAARDVESVPEGFPPICRAMTALGTPVGYDRDELNAEWDAILDRATARTARFLLLQHPQLIWKGLQQSNTWTRLQSVLGAAQPSMCADCSHLQRAEAADKRLWHALFGPYADQLGPVEWLIATLPRDLGGLGLRSTPVEALMAARHRTLYHAALLAGNTADARNAEKAYEETRSAVQAKCHTAVLNALPLHRRHVFMDGTGHEARTWLDIDALPSDPLDTPANGITPLMPDHVAHAAFALTVGLRVAPNTYTCSDTARGACPTAAEWAGSDADARGAHLALCQGTFHDRHRAMRDAVYATALEFHTPKSALGKETSVAPDGRPFHDGSVGSLRLRPGDVSIAKHGTRSGAQSIFVDVTAGGLTAGTVPKNGKDFDFIARRVDNDKRRQPGLREVQAAGQVGLRVSFSAYGRPTHATARGGRSSLGTFSSSMHCSNLYNPNRVAQDCRTLLVQRLSHACISALARRVVALNAAPDDVTEYAAADKELTEQVRRNLMRLDVNENDTDEVPAICTVIASLLDHYSLDVPVESRPPLLIPPCLRPATRAVRMTPKNCTAHAVLWSALRPRTANIRNRRRAASAKAGEDLLRDVLRRTGLPAGYDTEEQAVRAIVEMALRRVASYCEALPVPIAANAARANKDETEAAVERTVDKLANAAWGLHTKFGRIEQILQLNNGGNDGTALRRFIDSAADAYADEDSWMDFLNRQGAAFLEVPHATMEPLPLQPHQLDIRTLPRTPHELCSRSGYLDPRRVCARPSDAPRAG